MAAALDEPPNETKPLTTEAEPSGRGSSTSSARGLGLLSTVGILFFNVSGGPNGTEEIITAGGPLGGISLLLLFALFFSVPQAAMTAELSSAFPQNGGYSVWVTEAFGGYWGFQESYWSFVSGVVDNALYPVIVYSAVEQLIMEANERGGRDNITAIIVQLPSTDEMHLSEPEDEVADILRRSILGSGLSRREAELWTLTMLNQPQS